MKNKFLVIFGLLVLISLVACKSLQNEGGTDWVSVELTIGDTTQSHQYHASYSGKTGSALILAVPAYIDSVSPSNFLSENYGRGMLDLTSGFVELSVPLNTPLRIVEVVFTDVRTLGEATSGQIVAAATGISEEITINSTADKVTVLIELTNATPGFFNRAYIKASNASEQDELAWVAISGDTIVAGTSKEQSLQTTITNGSGASSDDTGSSVGAAYVFNRSDSIWSQQAYLKAPNAENNDDFGSAVAISGDTIVVGAQLESSNQTTITSGASDNNSPPGGYGAAYVFIRNGSDWSSQAYLKAPNAEAGDKFGNVVAISGDTIVVGAQFESSNETTITNGSGAASDNLATESGAVYVFVRSGTTWSQQAYLKAPNAEASDRFGSTVAISGDTIVVGAADEDNAETTITNGSGVGVDSVAAAEAGAVYVFVRSGTTWSQQAYLKAPNAEAGDKFGSAIAISGDTIAVGAPEESSAQATITTGASSDNSATESGAVYVFVRSGTTWNHQAYIKPSNINAGDQFGSALSISDDTIVVGTPLEASNQVSITNGSNASSDNSATAAGAAYVFVRNETTWTQRAYLKAPNADAMDYYGFCAISGNTIAVGAVFESSNQTTITNGSTASPDNSVPETGAIYVITKD